jgi:hypothetical protein
VWRRAACLRSRSSAFSSWELGGREVWRRSRAHLPRLRARKARIAAVRTRPEPLRVAAGLAPRRLIVS